MDSKLNQYLKLIGPGSLFLLRKAETKYYTDRKASGMNNTNKVLERFRAFLY